MKRAPIRVLLVEDNPLHAHLLQAFLSQAGEHSFPVRRARSLNEAFKLVREEPFDVVLLDLVLPESRGLGTFFRWRAQAPSLPVVVLTGLEDLDLATQAVESGAQDYLLKNQINGALLSRSLRYAVDRARARRREWDSPLFRSTSQQVMRALEAMGLDESLHQRLFYPAHAQIFAQPLQRTGEMIFSYWGRYLREAQGPIVGGVRVHPSVSLGDMAALSLRGTLQGALFGLPYQGAMGGVCVSPQEILQDELRELVQGFGAELWRGLSPKRGVLRADRGVDEEAMRWMKEGLESSAQEASEALIIGEEDGELSRAQGRGLILSLELLAEKLDMSLPGARVVIQGGVQSLELAQLFEVAGASVVGVGSAMGALVDEDGLDLEGMRDYQAEHGSLRGCPVGRTLPGEELFEVEADIFVTALADQKLRVEQAQLLRHKIVVEACEGVILSAADEVLLERGISLLPNLLAGGGADMASYFVWEARQEGRQIDEAELEERLKAHVQDAFERVWERAKLFDGDLRMGALLRALEGLQEELLKSAFVGEEP